MSRRPLANSEIFVARSVKKSKSLLASQGGSIAGVKACTNGCMSVLERSYFSYQVAAGKTMSESRVVEVIRKSALISRSSLPSGASSRNFTTDGLASAAWLLGIRFEPVPSRCLRKYSLPLAEDPNRFERQTTMVRGQFSGASMSSSADWSASPDFSLPAIHSWTVSASPRSTAALASSARSSGLRSNCG